jgi:hypothetical protein
MNLSLGKTTDLSIHEGRESGRKVIERAGGEGGLNCRNRNCSGNWQDDFN